MKQRIWKWAGICFVLGVFCCLGVELVQAKESEPQIHHRSVVELGTKQTGDFEFRGVVMRQTAEGFDLFWPDEVPSERMGMLGFGPGGRCDTDKDAAICLREGERNCVLTLGACVAAASSCTIFYPGCLAACVATKVACDTINYNKCCK